MAKHNSDLTPTMAASAMFEGIINQVRSSNLNFQIQMTPFSANILIKKTLIRDNAGSPIIPPTFNIHDEEIEKNYQKVNAEMEALKVGYMTIQSDLEEAMSENKSNLKVIKSLQDTIAKNEEMKKYKEPLELGAKKKKFSQTKAEIKPVNQKSTKSLPKNVSKDTKSNNDESEIKPIDDDVDMNYNVKVSNIFSPLQIPPEESVVSTKPSIATLSCPTLSASDPHHPCTPLPSFSSPQLLARTSPPSNLSDSDSGEFAGQFQNIEQELDKVKKILEEYQTTISGGTSSTRSTP